MGQASIMRFTPHCVTILHKNGHEFEFEAFAVERADAPRLCVERWRNRRLPLDADACRQDARIVAEQRFRDVGLI